jgi:negative regulator of genetic competence, sporulation and motility
MKIEKLTENKIRIILKKEDFKDKSINLNQFLTTPESQHLFLEILDKAEKETNFDTTGHKLLIEANIENDDIFIFTITKYIEKNLKQKTKQKKYLTTQKKHKSFSSSCLIYQFNEFDDFCNFCTSIYPNHNINLKGLFKNSTLYFYNYTYFLIIDGINLSNKSIVALLSNLLEFSTLSKYSKNFKSKLKEHGKLIIKHNAITTGIKYFT